MSATVDALTGAADDIVAVAHFGPILTQIRRATGQSAAAMLATRIDNLSLTRLAFDGAWRVECVNETP